ncbi:MAG: DUF2336 domain-containing protein [Alphaproteobacteria bacterium]
MTQMLTQADVQRLLEDPSSEHRREAAKKISGAYSTDALSSEERQIAEDILGVMARDVETSVRAALSENLKSFSGLSHDIALTLAGDVDAVALPILSFSDVLTDDDLIEIVRSEGTAKQTAVASRPTIGERVSEALVETENSEVVATLVANEGAEISEKSYAKVLDDFGDNEEINTSLVNRHSVPVSVVERLINLVSEKLQAELVGRYDLPDGVALDLIIQSRERATLGMLSPEASIMDVTQLVNQLHEADRLTPSIIVRAICMGDTEFFDVALSVLARIPLGAARALVHDAGNLGLPAVLDRANVPKDLFPVFDAAVAVANETEYDGGRHDRERFSRRMLERILTCMEDPGSDLGDGNAEYLLKRFSGLDVPGMTEAWQVAS